VCMKWGDKYPCFYVNNLYGMVSRQITGAFRFVCLTDQREGIRPEVECMDCPTVSVSPPYDNLGWRKLSLWSENLPDMAGDWLYLDLDVVITGGLDEFFVYHPQATFIVMQNWSQPGSGIGNTSVFRFRVGSHPYLLSDLVDNQQTLFATFRNSQTYISKSIKEIIFWPDEWCILFKINCLPPMPQRWWREPLLPASARVVAFPGVPNPHEVVNGKWPAVWYKRFYKHVVPPAWIKQYWRP
jgi:hypothetical protein